MKAESVRKSNWGIGIGMSLFVVGVALGCIMGGHSRMIEDYAPLLFVAGLISLFIGCMYYADAKGYSGAMAALAVLGLWGYLILYFLPDKCKEPLPAPIDESQDKAA